MSKVPRFAVLNGYHLLRVDTEEAVEMRRSWLLKLKGLRGKWFVEKNPKRQRRVKLYNSRPYGF